MRGGVNRADQIAGDRKGDTDWPLIKPASAKLRLDAARPDWLSSIYECHVQFFLFGTVGYDRCIRRRCSVVFSER